MRYSFYGMLCLAASLILIPWAGVALAQGPAPDTALAKAPAPPDTLRVWRSIISFKGSGINYSYGTRSGDVGRAGEGIKRVLKDDSLALRQAGAFGRHRVWGYAASVCCGACLGWGYSQQWSEDGADPQPFYLAGAGFLLLNVAISETGYRHLRKAARIFNENRRKEAEEAMGMGQGNGAARGGACCPAAKPKSKILQIRWQRLVEGGDTCPRCGDTGAELEAAADSLRKELAPRGVGVELVREELSLEEFKKDPKSSNRIWLNGRPLEEWLGAGSGQSKCCDVCGDEECRTLETDGKSYETVPRELILKAGRAAAGTLGAKKAPCCCGGE